MEQIQFDFDINDINNRINKDSLIDDQIIKIQEGWNVYEDYQINLKMEDISYQVMRNIKYYMIRIIYQNQQYNVESGWKDKIQKQQMDQEQCVNLFKKKFKEKTGNKWENRHQFIKHNGKYHIIDQQTKQMQMKQKEQNIIRNSRIQSLMNIDCNLNEETKRIMNRIYQFSRINKVMEEYGMKGITVNREQIDQSLKVLTQIQNELILGNNQKVIQELSNHFYQVIGQRNKGVINTKRMIQQKCYLLEILEGIEILDSLMEEIDKLCQVNPLDYIYERLSFKMQKIDDQQRMFINEMMKTVGYGDNQKYIVEEAVQIMNKEQEMMFGQMSKLDKQYLMTGIGPIQSGSVLKTGLLMGSQNTPNCYYSLEKGIYLYDSISKAVESTKFNRWENKGILIICRTALGRTQQIMKKGEQTKGRYHSITGLGRFQGNQQKEYQGIKYRIREINQDINNNSDFRFNTFIIQDSCQILIDYLVCFRVEKN